MELNRDEFHGALIFFGIVSAILAAIIYSCYFIVDPGYTALHLRMGKIVKDHTECGMYFKMPLVDSVIYINNRICKAEISTTALSKDLQTVSADVAINYRINNAIKLYKTVGTDFEKVILNPYSQESIKAIIARYTAEDLIRIRNEAKDEVFHELKDRLDPVFIELVDFNFVHLDFTPQFIHAVEEKQIAEQTAKTSHNLTEKVKEEAIQTRTKADAEAYALNIKKNCTTPEIIALKKIEKWNGKLPKVYGSSLPMLSLLDK
jgi:regulator of protease activity HflC (stomatin/prohibitin superfamily)